MTIRNWSVAHATLAIALSAIPALVIPLPAAAQSRAAVLDLDLPAGPLDASLVRLGRQAGVMIVIPPELARAKRTAGLRGRHPIDQALERLLRGTGLRATSDGAGGFVVSQAVSIAPRRRAAPVPPARAPMLSANPVSAPEIEEIVVSGYRATEQRSVTKTPQALKDTPQSVSVVTADVIADRGAQSLAEAMYFIPNVVTFNDGATGGAGGGGNSLGVEYNIRGIYESGQLNYRRVNGLRTHNRASIDLAALERVEVVRGPASMFGGAVPPGGIINLIPKRASETFKGFVTARVGSYDAKVIEADVGGALTSDGALRGRIAGKYVDEGSWIDFREGDLWVVTAALGADLTPDTTIDITGSFQRRTFVEGGSFAIGDDGWIPDIPRSRFVGIPTPRSEGELGWIDVELRQALASDWMLTVRGRYEDGFNAQRATEFSYYIDREAGLASLNKLNRRYSYDTFATDIFVSGGLPLFGLTSNFVFGADYFDNDETVYGGRTSDVATINIFDPDYGTDIGTFSNDLAATYASGQSGWGIYGQAIVRPVDRLAVHLGGRYDWARTTAGLVAATRQKNNAFTARASLTYEVTDTVTAYATYNESFIPSSGTTIEGDLVEPETGYQVEVGLKASLIKDRLNASIAAYRMVRGNVATYDPRSGTGEYFVIAVGEQVHKGIEVEIVGSPLPGLQLVASAAWQDARVTKNNDGMEGTIPYDAQEFTAAFLATYELQSGPLKGLGFGGSVRDLGKYYPYTYPQNLLAYNPPPIVDLQIFYRGIEKWDFRLNVFNIFDERYLSSASIYGSSTFGRPRSAMLSASRRF
ncbi:TonB-dependent siderophore receptor [Novosphingobium sp. Rr 2-17]|uniref:TonB-dependent siderophore receptor n=1 Tax=Novosphingobium sp. Rr 2-17 TaxID=555793 RepID=UPI0002699EE7|nr:TonB-dependent receptor [Novosphingobium sp. Rr 2-17]EIZ78439.1 TonB-dependent siderophore receptor [Novosphingobium sp. Rr 2-17]